MPHDHAPDDVDGRRLAAAVAINLGLTVAQLAGGLLAGSLALVADALHNLSDAVSLAVALLARRVARRPADSRMTFGYGRIEAVAALVNATALAMLGLWLVAEAGRRAFDPAPVEGWTVVALAGLALAVDAATAMLTAAGARRSVNIRAAFLHNLGDALASLAVIVSGALILLYDWRLADPLATLIVSGMILAMAWSAGRGAARVLMLGAPGALEAEAVVDDLTRLPGVARLHHVHLWRMEEHAASFDAHVVLAPGAEPAAVKRALRARLAERFGVSHATLETETEAEAERLRRSDGERRIGHDRSGGPGAT